ncbi:hypothetical protein BCD67_13920 [Oscillatoriales cyanobacterium USR001]|nr:hypothetical protein BCD67_13920 [Oscillatoriales cyanobacterium USR001]
MNTLLKTPQVRLDRVIPKSIIVASIATAGLLAGVVPSLSGTSPTLVFGTAAQAQETISSKEITSYARAVLAIEPRRLEAVQEIKGKLNGSIPQVVCNETKSINRLRGDVRGLAVSYCEQAKKIIEEQGLTVSRFNAITLSQQADPALKQKIQAELLRIQQEKGN